ncbi:MAG: heme ABC exporter, ATP-binding protein CcmA [Acidobacteria bacterium RIFCSPLOWO2_02_FULL_68_18]|nr:MAG: heme ABC exporter, ATP-binding protein CcmA [Acidobacteria bacterium RIFCSPLOWO2_02_FULL_68_18]OFW48479.1 MAG: heme ABC exporter, ATP-binding protein CcmA [Acidobacteria bacterium RIFCSPLOWO2_12_FULL_68_19]
MLAASHLTRRFGERVAVDDVSFELAPGEIFALLGPNGAGKTTTMRMLAGLIAPSSGTVRLGAEVVSRHSAPRLRGRIGLLGETPGLWDRLSVRRNLLVYARLHGLADPAAAVDEALERFGLRDRGGEPAAQLSKGLKQRVALARTLLHRPDILLLDEPTAGLDPESARDLRELVLRLRGERRTIVLSTHNLDEVERVADRVAVMRARLLAVDAPAALHARLYGPRLRVTIGQPAAPFLGVLAKAGFRDVQAQDRTLSIAVGEHAAATPAIVRRLVEEGADVLSVMPEQARLEDVYLHLVGREDAQ